MNTVTIIVFHAPCMQEANPEEAKSVKANRKAALNPSVGITVNAGPGLTEVYNYCL